MDKNEMVWWLKLFNVKGLGPRRALKLLETFGSIQAIADASDEALLRSRVFNEKMLPEWTKLKNAPDENFAKVYDECKQNGIQIIPLFAEEYPAQLKGLPNPPWHLFVQGDVTLLSAKSVAIVGSRSSEERATKWAHDTASELARNGVVIVSGGAKNIDFAAHRGALDAGGKTICVLGCGLLKPYPEEHLPLYDEIRKTGLLVSEHNPSFPGSQIALLQRNRITSGLSQAVIQVTSGIDGGSATQMRIAADQRIPIFCPQQQFTPSDGIRAKMGEYRIKEMHSVNDILTELGKSTGGQTTLFT